MKILMLTAQYLPEVYGGAEQQCRKLAEHLVAQGEDVTVLTSRKSKKVNGFETTEGVKVKRLLSYGPPQIMSLRYMHSSVIWLVKTIWWGYKNKERFDVIHVHQAKIQAFTGLLIARITKKRSIIKIGNSGSGFDLLTLKRKAIVGSFLYRYVIRHADVVIAISRDIQQELLDCGIPAGNIVFLPNGVEMRLQQPPLPFEKQQFRKVLDLPAYKKIFVFIGRLEKQKDVLLLIESFAMTEPLKNHYYLVVIGNGDHRKEVEEAVIRLNIKSSVYLAGYRKNVFDYIEAADFFVLSTKTEGLSNALLEAMSGGLIPISTNVSGSKDLIVENVNGYLTTAGSKISMKEAITKAGNLSEEERIRFSTNSFEMVKHNYNMVAVTGKYRHLYNTLILN